MYSFGKIPANLNRGELLSYKLRRLCEKVNGIQAAVLVNSDGLLMASHPLPTNELDDPTGGEAVAAMASVTKTLADRTLDRLQQGKAKRVILEGEHGTIAVLPAGQDASLAIILTADAKIGLATLAASQIAEDVTKIIDS